MFSGDSIALSSVISLEPGGTGSTEFCLAWDMPIIRYKKDKKVHKRYVSQFIILCISVFFSQFLNQQFVYFTDFIQNSLVAMVSPVPA